MEVESPGETQMMRRSEGRIYVAALIATIVAAAGGCTTNSKSTEGTSSPSAQTESRSGDDDSEKSDEEQPTTDEKRKESNSGAKKLVGVWQDAPSMGGGWADVYVFDGQGRYEFHPSDECHRVEKRVGDYRLEDGTLVLRERRRVETRGGKKVVTKSTGCLIKGAQSVEVEHPEPLERHVTLERCAPEVRNKNAGPLPCRKIDGTAYWRYREDPAAFPDG